MHSSHELVFGVSSIPLTTVKPNYLTGFDRTIELGLGAFEIPFGQFINMSEKTAAEFKEKVEAYRNETGKTFRISVHAPYFINLNALDELKVAESIQRVLKAAVRGNIAGATNIVLHTGFYVGRTPEEAYEHVKEATEKLFALYEKEVPGERPMLRPETTGKQTQFGTIAELIRFCTDFPQMLPCIDFAHLHAKSNGKVNSYEEYAAILTELKNGLGEKALQNMHIHYCGIQYTEKGEKKHLPLKESDANFIPLMQALADFHVGGEVISESPIQEHDALLLQETYLACTHDS